MSDLVLTALAIVVSAAAIVWSAWEAGRNYEVQRAAKRAAKEVIPNDSDHSGGIAVTGGAHPTNAPCKKHKIRGVAVGTHTITNDPSTCIVCGARVSPLSAEIILDRIGK